MESAHAVPTLTLPLSYLLEVTQPGDLPELVTDGSVNFEEVAKAADTYWTNNAEALTKTAIQAASMVKVESLSIYSFMTQLHPGHDPTLCMLDAQTRRNEIVRIQDEVKGVFASLSAIAVDLEAVRDLLKATELEQATIAGRQHAGKEIQASATGHKDTAITWFRKIDNHARQARAAEAAMFNAIGSANNQLATLAVCLDINDGASVSAMALMYNYGASKSADVMAHVFPSDPTVAPGSIACSKDGSEFEFQSVVASSRDESKTKGGPANPPSKSVSERVESRAREMKAALAGTTVDEQAGLLAQSVANT